MHRSFSTLIVASSLFALPASDASAQLARTRSPAGELPAGPGIPRSTRFPYAGSWTGIRIMQPGSDEIRFDFSVVNDEYVGATIHPDGGKAPHNKLVASASGLTWEQPNSGGGTWVFTTRLVGPDSLVGTIVLRDPPANLTPAPTGTMALVRKQSSKASAPRDEK